MTLRVKSKFWIEDDQGRPIFGSGKRTILEKIEEHGSISAAAEAMHMSYRAVWGKIKTTEERLGLKLVETAPGRGSDKSSWLTPAARELLGLFQSLEEQGLRQADELFQKVFVQHEAPKGPASHDRS
ncbi:MAG: LysR family transcriptional regulator [Thermodesulfobacteriota bacterium]